MEIYNTSLKIIYIILIVIISVLIVRILFILANIGKDLEPISQNLETINNDVEALKDKTAKIEHTAKTAIPFFISVIAGASIFIEVVKDYLDTKPKKRSIHKSFKKVSKYKKIIKPLILK